MEGRGVFRLGGAMWREGVKYGGGGGGMGGRWGRMGGEA